MLVNDQDRFRESWVRLRTRGVARFAWDATWWRVRAFGRMLGIALDVVVDAVSSLVSRLSTGFSGLRLSRLEAPEAPSCPPSLLSPAPEPPGRRRRRHASRAAKVLHFLTLTNHRAAVRQLWPGTSKVDESLLAVAMAVLRFHNPLLRMVCTHAHWLRVLRPPRARKGNHVLHVTASFDLGGTQTQIKNLCINESHATRLTHEAVEIFPEYNFSYRTGPLVEERYVAGGRLSRVLGKLIVNLSTRSYQLIQIAKLVNDMRAVKPDIVIGWGHEIAMITFVAAAIARVPRIVFCIRTFNPSFAWCSPAMGVLLHAAHRRMIPHLSSLVVNSTPLQQDYSSWLGIDPGLITVCPNGIDAPVVNGDERAVARAEVRQRYGIPSNALVVINVGRFSAEKGQMSLMHANRELLQRCPSVDFVWLLCGDGPTLAPVRAYVEEHHFANVVFVGRTSDVSACLQAADIFVMPSDFEGMPNAMMEAMAHGLPAISTTRSGIVDVARADVEALYYEPRDVARLVDHLAFLFSHDDERRAMGERAERRMQEFSVAASVHRFERVLLQLNGHSPQPHTPHPTTVA